MLGEGVEQLRVFVVFAVLGLALTSAYVFGSGVFRSRLAIIIFDSIFGVGSVCAVVAVNVAVNNGECRLFVFVGLIVGAIICIATCKTLLDKVSSALYNLFTTTSEDNIDEPHVPQQKNIDTDSSVGADSTDTGMHATDNAHTDVIAKTTRRMASSANKRRVRKRSRNRTVN